MQRQSPLQILIYGGADQNVYKLWVHCSKEFLLQTRSSSLNLVEHVQDCQYIAFLTFQQISKPEDWCFGCIMIAKKNLIYKTKLIKFPHFMTEKLDVSVDTQKKLSKPLKVKLT